MAQHVVYIDDRPVRFAPISASEEISMLDNCRVVSESDFSIEEVLDGLHDLPISMELVYLCENPDATWKRFVYLYTLSIAAGGVVRNEAGEVLVIFRRGKWDLPKGKLDYDETPEHAALREVTEECGINQLQLGAPIAVTYHTYVEKKKRFLKKTHWYYMQSSDDRPLVPQLEEDIEQAVWMTTQQVLNTVFANTYRSVRSVLEMALIH